MSRRVMKHWEDKFIFGTAGFWYVIIGDAHAGYFHCLARARACVRKAFAS